MMMKRTFVAMIAVAAISAPALGVTTVYTDQASFLAATAPGLYVEDFSSIGFGAQGPSLSFGPVNGYGFTVEALNELFSGGGNMSTNTAFDPLIITTSGSPTAVGGNFWLTDFDFLDEVGDLTVTLADGSSTSETLTDATGSTFLGFVSDSSPIASVTLTPVDPGDGINRWATVDNLHLGAAVPEPASFSLLGMAALALLGLRRK